MSYRHVPPPSRDVGVQLLATGLSKGLSFVPVVGPILSALGSPIASALHDWFSAGEAGEKFFHETYLPKKATPTHRGALYSRLLLQRKLRARL